MKKCKNILAAAAVLSLSLACGNVFAGDTYMGAVNQYGDPVELDAVTSSKMQAMPTTTPPTKADKVDPTSSTKVGEVDAAKKSVKKPHTKHHDAKKTDPKN